MMPKGTMKPKLTETTTTTKSSCLKLDRDDLVEVLRKAGYNVSPSTASIHVQGSCDRIDVEYATLLEIHWTTIE